jgi:glycosyltransferase involved in cell wall biosynthesis
MKILHLHTELNLACGITRTISQIISKSSVEFEHHLISMGGNAIKRFEANTIHLKVVSINRHSLPGTIKLFFILINYCRKKSIQIVHSHHRYFDALIWFIRPFLKVKTVTSIQSKVYGKKVLSYKADMLIACSNTIKKHLISNFNLPEYRIKVIYNSVDPAVLKTTVDKQKLKTELGINPQDFVIGFVGRIDFAEKGIDLLLAAFRELQNYKMKIHLLMIGDGPNHLEVQEFYELNKSEVSLLSSKENIFDYYNLMDLVVLPSRVDPFPLAMLETGLMNLPFIGSNVDGIAELIQHEKYGLLFESRNVDDLKIQILRIFKDKTLADTLAYNLNKKVFESYTVEKIIPQYEVLYKNILNGIHENC